MVIQLHFYLILTRYGKVRYLDLKPFGHGVCTACARTVKAASKPITIPFTVVPEFASITMEGRLEMSSANGDTITLLSDIDKIRESPGM